MEVMQRTHTPQAAHEGVINHLRKRGRQRRIKRVSTFFKDFGTHLGSARLRTYDDPFHHDSLFILRLIKK
jgi:hypothetical protein